MRASARARRPGSRARPAHMRRPLPRAASGGASPVACARVLQSGRVPLDIARRRTKIPFSTRSPRLLNGQTGRYEKESDANYAQVQNREQEAARPHDQLHLHEPRDLPARAHLERVATRWTSCTSRSLTDKDIQLSKDELGIRVAFDKDARTVTVSDSGLGMTKDELDRNLGTIAHSDSMEFKADNADAQGDDVDIIGQFGVGFYSAFMVASKVRVVSKAYGSDEAWAWESDGVEGYTIERGPARGPRHRRHPHAEGQHRRRQLRHVPQRVRLAEPHQALQQLRALPRADGSVEDARAAQARGRRRRLQTRVRGLHRGRDHQLDDPHLEAQQVRGHRRGVQRVLQDRLPRLHRPGAHVQHPRRGRAQLRRAAVHPRPRAVRPVQQGLQEGPGAVQLQRPDHGEVRGAAARPLQLRARRGGQPGPAAEHQPRDAAAQQPAAAPSRRRSRRRSRPS